MTFDFPRPIVLENQRARLRPLALADHAALQPVAADPELWAYTLTRGDTPESLRDYLVAALDGRAQGLRYPFALEDRASGRLAGSTSYYNVSETERRLSIGYTWVGRDFQRSGLNRAAKALLLGYAFDTLGAERVELETDTRNHKSQEAMRRLGATQEGTLRSHRYTQGGLRRDTVIFSVLRAEWPELQGTVFQEFTGRG